MEDSHELLARLLKEEIDLRFTEFTNDTAYKIGNGIIQKAIQEDKRIVVDIRKQGELLFYARMDEKTSRNDEWVAWKNNVVHHYGHSSYYMNVFLNATNAKVEDAGLNPEEYKAVGGAFPLYIQGEGIVGTLTVSGLKGEQDHSMVVDVLRELVSQ